MLCRHGGQASLDGDLREDTAAAVCSEGNTGQHVGTPGRSTQVASFLYDMYLDDEDLEAFMASVDVKGAFPNTPHRLI